MELDTENNNKQIEVEIGALSNGSTTEKKEQKDVSFIFFIHPWI